MPYFVTNDNPDCSGWAVEKEDGEVIGCHRTRQEAIDQMVAVSLAEEIEPGGERSDTGAKQYSPPQGAREEAERGLAWREEYGRGGTAVGVARARDIANGRNLSEETIRRMVSYFARHEVDKQGQGWSPGEDGYPSAGRIAWALWGGDPGRSWAQRILASIEREEERGTRSEKEGVQMLTKTFPMGSLEVKAASKEAPHGEFTALVSVFGNTDLVGDRVMPGAFAKSLQAYQDSGKTLPIVWSHDWGNAESFIGKALEAVETDEGLKIRGAFFDTPRAQTVRTLLAEKVVTEFSFAYDTIEEETAEDGVNELKELHILEAGPTLKGANPATQLLAAKTAVGIAAKAEPGELEEGSYVTWAGEDENYGRVEYIMTEGTFGVEGDPLSLTATPEDPLAMVRVYDEEDGIYQATGLFRGFRFSELTLTEEKGAESTEAKSASVGNAKAGRTLSAKNENSIREAKSLLEGVLSSLEPAEPAKSEDPEKGKDKERGMDPETAVTLLALTEIEIELP